MATRITSDRYIVALNNYSFTLPQLPPLKAMENPADYDIDKDMGDEEVDEAKIGNIV